MSINNLKFIFFGTPDIASKTLSILKSNGYIPEVVITSPNTRSGRGLDMHETPVSMWCTENNIKCLKPEKIDEAFIEMVKNLNIDLSIVVAYGKILPEKIINIPHLGTINIHYSLLPKYRGASPLEACLLNGDDKTGISIQQMEYKLDSGPIIIEKVINIDVADTKSELREKLITLGGNTLFQILPNIVDRTITLKKQDDDLATYCKKIKKPDGEIDITGNQSIIWNKYRAFYGWPGVFYFINKNNRNIRIKISHAIYENNSFIIKRVIPEGKKEINYEEFLKSNLFNI